MKRINSELLSERIERRAAEDLAACNIGGASVLVAQSGKIIYRKHFGTTSPLGGEPVSDFTLFRLASMTKPITAVATMILVERGLLSLEDSVTSFYPSMSSLQVRGADGTLNLCDTPITIRNLLSHTSGIGSGAVWVDAVSQITARDMESVDAFVDFMARQPLSFVPGTAQEYSAVGAFGVLTGIIQKIADMPYEDFLKKELFEPCEMLDTTFAPSEAQWGRVIGMHDRQAGRQALGRTWDGCVFEFFPPACMLGGAGLISSLADYLNFAGMLLDRGVFAERRILSAESVSVLSAPRILKKAHESWGLSVRVIHDAAHDTLPQGAFGWSGAYGTHFWVDPQNEIVAIYLKNSRYDGGAGAVTAKNFEIDVYSSAKKN